MLVLLALLGGVLGVWSGNPSIQIDSQKNFNVELPTDGSLFIHRRDSSIDVLGLDGRVQGLEQSLSELTYQASSGAVSNVSSDIVDGALQAKEQRDTFLAEYGKDMETNTNEYRTAVTQLNSTLASNRSLVSNALNTQVSSSNASLQKLLQQNSAELEQVKSSSLAKLQSAVKTLQQKIGSFDVSNRYIWIGGSRGTYRHGWRDFPLDRVELDVGAPYFKREGNRFRVLKPGFFRLNYGGIMHGGWCHAHMDVRIDNKRVRDSTHNYIPGTWQWAEMENTFYVKANQQVWMRIYGCNYAIHGSGGYDAHNRLTFEFIGDRPKQCTGLYCNGI